MIKPYFYAAMMTVLTRASNNQPVSLVKQIASSGEGEVWETNESGILAKIYHNPTLERIKKLKVMLANPPADPMLSFNHISIAWPQDLLKDGSGACIGFLMPAIRGSRELTSIYNPRLRKQKAPGFNWYYLHTAALNIAWIIQAIHDKGYVLGDIKPQNILVNDRALVAVIDTDSFQVRDSQSGKVYCCTVGSEGFTPVELLGKDFSVTEQTEVHDRFRLAVLIHYLLFGYHPFSGEWTGNGDSPDQTELIRKGFWPYSQNSLIRASLNTISLDIVHPEIKRCFLRCFNDGHTSPDLRPTAEDWHNALQVAVNELIVCVRVDSHYYSQNYGKCYWCERKAQLGVDIFPGISGTATTAVKTTTTPSTTIQNVTPSTPSNQTTRASAPVPTQSVASSTPLNQTIKASASVSSGRLNDWQKSAITGTVIGCFVLIGLILTRSQTPPSTQPYSTSTTAQASPQQRTTEPTLPSVVKPSPVPEVEEPSAPVSDNEPVTPSSEKTLSTNSVPPHKFDLGFASITPNSPSITPNSPANFVSRGQQLDDMADKLFDERHPELRGRKIQSNEIVLAREWKQIRQCDAVVDFNFSERHPELEGRKIIKGETDLVREWLQIKRTVGGCN